MIGLRVGSEGTYTDFLSVSVSYDIENLVGSFSFQASADKDNLIPIKVGQYIQVIVDDTQFMAGFVESLDITGDAESHTIDIAGRSILADLIDSVIPDTKVFTGAFTLETITRKALDELGYKTNKIINRAGDIDQFSSTDIEELENDSKVIDFLMKLAKKRQVLLNTDPYGNLIFTRGNIGYSPCELINKQNNDTNNIISFTFSIDESNRFHKYIVKSSLNPTNDEDDEESEVIVNQIGEIIDAEITRTSRITEIVTDENMDSDSCLKRAQWEANFRKAQSMVYKVTLPGHSVNGNIWYPNKLVKVIDEFCNLSTYMLVKSVKFTYNERGSITELECVDRDSYTLKSQLDAYDASSSNKSGKSFSRTYDEMTNEQQKKEQQANKQMRGNITEDGYIVGEI